MSIVLRVFLIACALLVLAFMIRRVKKAEIHAKDTVFWLLLAVCLVTIAIIPQIAYFFTELLGIESPSNFVFLFVIAVLFIREFTSTIEIAKLRNKLTVLAQEIALARTDEENKKEQR